MNYNRTHRITLFERVAAMNLPDIPVVMERIGANYQRAERKFPNGGKLIEGLGLDLAGEVSSPELTAKYVEAYCKLNGLKR